MPGASLMYAHVECVRPVERDTAGRLLTPKMIAQCADENCGDYEEMWDLVDGPEHELRCPKCGGSALRLTWWMTGNPRAPDPEPCAIVRAEVPA